MKLVNIDYTFEGASSGHLNAALVHPINAFIDESILHDLDPCKNGLIPCQIVGFRTAAGLSITASVLIDGHNLYSEIPFHMVYMTDQKPDSPMRLDDLVCMNSPPNQSMTFAFHKAIQRQSSHLGRNYLGTIQWQGRDGLAADIVALNNGQLSLVPNHGGPPTSMNIQDHLATIPYFLRTVQTGTYQGFNLQGFHSKIGEPLAAILYDAEVDNTLHVPVDTLYTGVDPDLKDALPQNSLLFKPNPGDFSHYTYYDSLGGDAARCYFKDTKENRFGEYLGTIDYYNGGDFIAHLVRLDNDQVALLPSHKVQFNIDRDNALTVKPPRYAKLSHAFIAEPKGDF